MSAKSAGLKSDLARIDAHVIQPEEYQEIPELPPEFFAEGELFRHGKPVRRRGPQKAPAKVAVTIRLDPAVVGFFRAQGKGWQSRMDAILREWVAAHQ